MNDDGNTSSFTCSQMNQYVVNGAAYNFDGNFNLASAPNWAGGFDAQTGSCRPSAYGNRFLDRDREWIAELSLYDYWNRVYFPPIGRFPQLFGKHRGPSLNLAEAKASRSGGLKPPKKTSAVRRAPFLG
jgi:hypothetical protein